jgi:hypothetical protein
LGANAYELPSGLKHADDRSNACLRTALLLGFERASTERITRSEWIRNPTEEKTGSDQLVKAVFGSNPKNN